MEQSDLNLLYTVPPHHLQTLVKTRRLPLSPRAQNIIMSSEPSPTTIAEIGPYLFNPASISKVLPTLDEKEMLILHELAACGGRANSRDLALYLESSRLLHTGKAAEGVSETSDASSNAHVSMSGEHGLEVPRYPVPHPHGVFELALRHLLMLGLLFWGKQTNFGGRDYASGIYDGVLIVPQAVMQVVGAANAETSVEATEIRTDAGHGLRNVVARRFIEGATRAGRHPGDGVPAPTSQASTPGEGLYALQRTLYLYWSLVAGMREGLFLVNNGLLSRSALRQVVASRFIEGEQPGMKAVEQIRVESEVPRLLFIRLLLMKLGLLREQEGTVRAAPADTFFALPLLERARRCYRLWLELPFWNELTHLPDIFVRPGPGPLDPAHEEVVQARQTVVERLLTEQPGVWCEFATFIAHTRLYAPYLLFPRRYGLRTERYSMGSNPYGWDFRLRRGWLTHREGWHLVEGGFIRAVVSGPLRWLGLVDVNNEDTPTAFRLASGALFVMSDEPTTLEEPAPGRLIVQPNFELVALAPISEALLIKLDRFAERINLERIAQYRLTKASVTSAVQMGLHAEDIRQTLEKASGGEIPQNVQYSLLEWERQARRIELWSSATLLEVDDAALLDALFAHEQTRSLLGRRLTPSLVEVPRHQLSALQQALWERDYLPVPVSAREYDNPLDQVSLPTYEPQWRLHDDGLLAALYPVPNLYLMAELKHISEPDQATGWRRITPASLQHALNTGLSLDYIVRFLESYCEDGVPTSFLIRLKLWGGGYDSEPTISVEHAPLLSLSSQVLQDLQADEEVRALLGTEVAQEYRLVHVPPDNLQRVIELLRERGFEVP